MQRLKRRADNRNNNDFSKADFSLDFTRQYNNDRVHNETNPDIHNHRNKHLSKYYY